MPPPFDDTSLSDSMVSSNDHFDSSAKHSVPAAVNSLLSADDLETASFRSPFTPASGKESDCNPWHSNDERESSDSGKPSTDTGKERLASNVCRINGEENLAKETEDTAFAREEADVTESYLQPNASSPCHRELASISDLAKKARLRVKRVKRAAKPNVFEKRGTTPEPKDSNPHIHQDVVVCHKSCSEASNIDPAINDSQESPNEVDIQLGESLSQNLVDGSVNEHPSSGAIVAESLKEKILRKSSQSREKYARHYLEDKNFDESRSYLQETEFDAVKAQNRYHGSVRVTQSASLPGLPDVDADHCFPLATRMNHTTATVNNARAIYKDSEQLREEVYGQEHQGRPMHDAESAENKTKNSKDSELHRIGLQMEYSLHSRRQGLPYDTYMSDKSLPKKTQSAMSEAPLPDEPPGFSCGRPRSETYDQFPVGSHIRNEMVKAEAIAHNEAPTYAVGFDSKCNDAQHPILPVSESGCAPFSHLIQMNWKWSSDSSSDLPNNRIKIVKERSIFVGCIPDGVEKLELLLRNLMEQFLERFDFAPVRLGQVQVIKTVKDFAFIELASDKVAQIVLAANQLDVFEWGINGYHFNIQGCTATYTSVRPLIEYMSFKPSRVVFVGNIPKFRWQKEYLKGYFSKILQGSDGPTDWTYVSSVYLLPDSSDAYVEMTSELMTDALMFKCTKIPEFLREIGPDVFICRDVRSVPLMSRHKGAICPQRSLYIGVTPIDVEFKIDAVMKVFNDILPFIARNSNQRGYLEYVNTQPGKDYAFFQFNTEAFVDAIMDEYIENTQIFICRESNVPYIILRPPGYVRPGARYGSDFNNRQPIAGDIPETERSRRARSDSLDPSVNIGLKSRRFGDEPVKKPDCIVSVGASPVPSASWNGQSAGSTSTDPDCMIYIDGLPERCSYRLIHGALNELFERSLCHTGLLEVGMLLVRYLDHDGDFAVANLPSAEFVSALLSMRKVFLVAGEEIRLLCKDWRRSFHWKSNPADLSGGHCELSSLSDEDSQGRTLIRNSVDYNTDFVGQSNQAYSGMDGEYPKGYDRRMGIDSGTDEWCQSEGWNASPQGNEWHRNRENLQWRDSRPQQQSWNTAIRSGKPFHKAPDERYCEGNNPKVRVPHISKGSGFCNMLRGEEGGSRLRKKGPDDGFRVVSREGKRIIQQVSSPHETGQMGIVPNRKRKPSEIVEGIPVNINGFSYRNVRHQTHYT